MLSVCLSPPAKIKTPLEAFWFTDKRKTSRTEQNRVPGLLQITVDLILRVNGIKWTQREWNIEKPMI